MPATGTATETSEATIPQPPAPEAAVRAGKATRPTQPLQVVQTVRISPEPGLELAQGPRIVRASVRVSHDLSLPYLRLNGYSNPVLWQLPR